MILDYAIAFTIVVATLVTLAVPEPPVITVTFDPLPVVDSYHNDLPRTYNPQRTLTMGGEYGR